MKCSDVVCPECQLRVVLVWPQLMMWSSVALRCGVMCLRDKDRCGLKKWCGVVWPREVVWCDQVPRDGMVWCGFEI